MIDINRTLLRPLSRQDCKRIIIEFRRLVIEYPITVDGLLQWANFGANASSFGVQPEHAINAIIKASDSEG